MVTVVLPKLSIGQEIKPTYLEVTLLFLPQNILLSHI